MDDREKTTTIIMLLLLTTVVGSSICSCINTVSLKREAIERNYAQYNPQTGEWEWLPPVILNKDKE